MDFLFSGYSALRGDKGQPQTGPETIDKLTDRVVNSTLLEDRRAAVLGLKGLARDWKLEVGTKGMAALINVLKNDRMDVEIIKAALETLSILCTPDAQSAKEAKMGGKPSSPGATKDSKDLGVMFTEIYVKTPSNVTDLLEILEEFEFYVRFNTIQLLSTIMENMGDRLQECILTSPMGISRLMDLLDDRREIIRNEGLLLLISLTQNNAEIQKIIAFENAFERLLGIILEEGAAEGGIIVQDCLTLTLNLLRYNVSNQNLFRESSCIQRIPSLLLSHTSVEDESGPIAVPLTHEANTWTEQKIANTVHILELVRILMGANNPNTTVHQNVMHQAHILPPIIDIAMSDRIPNRVKAQALYAVGDSIRGNIKNQDLFAKYVIVPGPTTPVANKFPKPALLTVVKIALKSDNDYLVRAAATYCFQCLVYNNPDGQLALAATLTPPPPENPNDELSEQPQSPGSLIVLTLLEPDISKSEPYKIWFAACMLAHILTDNQKAKEMALTVRIDENDGDEPISLLHKIMYSLLVANRQNADLRILVGILSFVASWLFDSTKAVKEFLSEGSNLQFLIEQINQSSGVDPLVQGISAFLLAICHDFNDDSEPAFTQASLQTLIVSRIGADVFVSRIERMKESKYFQKASPYLEPSEPLKDTRSLPDVYFDKMFVDLVKSTAESMVKGVINPKGKTSSGRKSNDTLNDPQQKTMMESYKTLIASQDKELNELRRMMAEAEQRHMQEMEHMMSQLSTLHQKVGTLEATSIERESKYDTLCREQEDLLVCLAESDITIRQLKDRLRALGQEVESDDEGEGGDGDDGGDE
ncbi:Vesicle-mediated ER to Golgi transport protein [Blyttiomyces sp. JEL0837]|nr:Vesicle-mediated ER to Golgi transport protein [Blyttiomyces sp. JEL0837]